MEFLCGSKGKGCAGKLVCVVVNVEEEKIVASFESTSCCVGEDSFCDSDAGAQGSKVRGREAREEGH